jgi:hypothetical protein
MSRGADTAVESLAQSGPRLGHRKELLWADVICATNIACAANGARREVAASTAHGGLVIQQQAAPRAR